MPQFAANLSFMYPERPLVERFAARQREAHTAHGLGRAADDAAVTATTPPVLAVAATTLQPITLPVRLGASGNIMAWQEASIGTEADGLRLTTVRVNVGDVVRHGELLATFAADTIKAELAQDRATLAEAEALFAEARDTARRARELQSSGALSAQHIHRAMIAERTAGARLAAARAAEQKQRLLQSYPRCSSARGTGRTGLALTTGLPA